MLLVPVSKKTALVEHLELARQHTNYRQPVSLKRIRGPGSVFDCADAWIQIGVASLMSNPKNWTYPIFLGKREPRRRKQYSLFKDFVGAKFIVFCERDLLSSMIAHPDRTSKVETTFRIGMKGGLHFLGSDENPIRIEKIHFDGYLHHHRHINSSRIVGRLTGLRSYCSISSRRDLIDDRTGNHKKPDCQPYEDCQLLQLTDLLIGSFRVALIINPKPLHRKLAYPVRQLVQRYRKGYARMKNSRWFKSFCISRCYLASGNWRYDTFEYTEVNPQIPLPFTTS